MALAIFDLDETLIASDSDHEWGQFLADNNIVDPEVHKEKNDYFYQQYLAGELNIDEYLDFACSVLTRFDLPTLHEYRRAFVAERIEPVILPAAEEIIASHRKAGDFLMVITSTIQFVVEPIVARLGIETLIAPVPELIDDRYTGRIVGTPSFGEGKLLRLNEWLQSDVGASFNMEGSFFYSDSHNDLPLLNVVDHPVAVNPDDKLRSVANEKQWKVLDIRD